MGTNLMGFAGDEVHPQEGIGMLSIRNKQGLICCLNGCRISCRLLQDSHLIAFLVLTEITTDLPGFPNHTIDHRKIILPKASFPEQHRQLLQGRQGFSENQKPGSIPIQAVGDGRLKGLKLRTIQLTTVFQIGKAYLIRRYDGTAVTL